MSYTEITNRVRRALAQFDAKQQDAQVWAWLDYQACNANHLRDAIAQR